MAEYPRRLILKFLKDHGIELVRTTGKHNVYNNKTAPLDRPVTLRRSDKDVPDFHVWTTLENMGLTKQYFKNWLKRQ